MQGSNQDRGRALTRDGSFATESVRMNNPLTRTNRPDFTFQFSFVRLIHIVRSLRLDSQTHPLVADGDSQVTVHSLTVLSGEDSRTETS